MTWEWAALGGLAVTALVALVALARLRRRTAAELAVARTEAAELRVRLERLEQRAPLGQQTGSQVHEPEPLPAADGPDYTITRVGEPAPTLERAAFADLVLRESVIRIGSLAHGVRRALDPETRNRIRFEMRREVKRARKQRRAEQREAYREWQARQRARADDELKDTA